jgi:hypothetical protein
MAYPAELAGKVEAVDALLLCISHRRQLQGLVSLSQASIEASEQTYVSRAKLQRSQLFR